MSGGTKNTNFRKKYPWILFWLVSWFWVGFSVARGVWAYVRDHLKCHGMHCRL